MKAHSIAVIVLLSLFGLSGCSNLISATKEEPINEEPTTRTTGSFIDDELIEIKSLVNISKASEELKQSHIAVTSFNGIVLLTGQVPNENARQLTESVVGQVRKVRKIHNELSVAGPTSAIVRSNDTWLTAKIKAKMLAEENLKSTRIKVVTENGAVYLMGLVSEDQARMAVEITRNTVGVQKVVKMFEYVS
ncbi:BON domain-containing protein [Motiliproteus coralliicola]|uniref:BON domain-containing protein n=1 Tax=Motiliproteus coralliicola TaxID=2283196 RepID=A0A369WPW9_9GAMM|nr:BON domain-containing protein [Motiliproteus coralliicola]RDE22664.1 BON domain-containing protein [Motiliproteus coralliicola]